MKVVVVGATGNVGTSLLESLAEDPSVSEIIGIARRKHELPFPKTTFVEADVRFSDLVPLFEGADAVVHLAWAIQPSRDLATVRAINVDGSERVFRAAGEAGVGGLVYASSIGAYSPGPKMSPVAEDWPTEGIQSSFYSRHKAEVERLLDKFEVDHPEVRVVRLRPGLLFKREAATGVRRLFIGPFLPPVVFQTRFLPVLPNIKRLAFQALHTMDVAEAYRLAITKEVRGAFNVAAEPVLDPGELARLLEARLFPLPAAIVRVLVDLTWKMRLHPTPSGWLDLALGVPLMDCTRARQELGWSPRFTSGEALLDLFEGLRDQAGLATPPLDPKSSGVLRSKEILTGIGAR
jgi:nucleoside-diphosphate-sugar epimerase